MRSLTSRAHPQSPQNPTEKSRLLAAITSSRPGPHWTVVLDSSRRAPSPPIRPSQTHPCKTAPSSARRHAPAQISGLHTHHSRRSRVRDIAFRLRCRLLPAGEGDASRDAPARAPAGLTDGAQLEEEEEAGRGRAQGRQGPRRAARGRPDRPRRGAHRPVSHAAAWALAGSLSPCRRVAFRISSAR